MSVHAWSDEAHRVVALAVQEHMSDRVKLRITYLVGKETTLVDVATWANKVAAERPETEAWQSITIPPGAKKVDLARDCPLGECVTAKVREFQGIVRLAIRGRSEIVEAFKMLVGLAADLHQPLQGGLPPGDGKEDSLVMIDGSTMSLLDAWESELVRRLGSEEEVLKLVLERIASADHDAWTAGSLRDWTWETHRLAVDRIYPIVADQGPTVLQESTLDEASGIVVEQLAKSAVRLGHLLATAWP